ncbi:hypothetical protein NM688_g936 [Phlebia brevispora]|uniref:Uncharacterized protein n=1 Tax=Phlebia brevispora TaxID=194682 RepID=A0ACC1TCR9_9APHY|nr:hypothetical protein NM688_g936 [Phlebia brevispora]
MTDPIPTYTHIVRKFVEEHPNLAFLDIIEPGISGNIDGYSTHGQSNDFIRALWAPRPIISAGGYTRETALEVAETSGKTRLAFETLQAAITDCKELGRRESHYLNAPASFWRDKRFDSGFEPFGDTVRRRLAMLGRI